MKSHLAPESEEHAQHVTPRALTEGDSTAPASTSPPVTTIDRSHIRARRRAAAADQHREIHESVGSLHAFVDLFDQVRGQRIRGLRLLVGLNVADVVTTAWFLAWGGSEGNPVLAPIITRWWLVVLVKATILAVVAKSVLSASPRSVAVRRLVAAAIVYYSAVVLWNFWVIAQLG